MPPADPAYQVARRDCVLGLPSWEPLLSGPLDVPVLARSAAASHAKLRGSSAAAQSSASGLDGLKFVGGKVEEPAVIALQLGEGVTNRADRDVHLAVHVVQDRLDQRLAPGEEEACTSARRAPGRITTRLPRA